MNLWRPKQPRTPAPHCRPMLSPFEAKTLLLVLQDGTDPMLETWEEAKALRRAKAKIGAELARVGGAA